MGRSGALPERHAGRLSAFRYLHSVGLCLYSARMAAPNRSKRRVNLTVDPAIYGEAMKRFQAVDMSMSAFVEAQMALFLQITEPLAPLFEAVERGEADPMVLKIALRAAFSGATVEVGEVKITGPLSHGFAPSSVSGTDKK